MTFYLGMDIGGTKTHCLIGTAEGNLVGFGAARCGSYEYHGVEAAKRENQRAIEAALEMAGIDLTEIAAVGLGVAGADLPPDFAMLEEQIYTPLFGGIPRIFKNDSFAALRGGTRDPYGIVVACGTDSVCAGINPQGEETRVGGFGPDFGNKCSGRIIGREGLQEVWRAREGIAPPTRLTEKFVARAGLADADELFEAFYYKRMTYDELEPVAALVFEAAVDGDSAARAILADGGRFLAAMVNAVAKRLAMTELAFDVVMAGSVFRGASPHLIDALKAAVADVCPRARCVRPAFEPVVGALFLAYDAGGQAVQPILPNIERNVEQAPERFQAQLRTTG